MKCPRCKTIDVRTLKEGIIVCDRCDFWWTSDEVGKIYPYGKSPIYGLVDLLYSPQLNEPTPMPISPKNICVRTDRSVHLNVTVPLPFTCPQCQAELKTVHEMDDHFKSWVEPILNQIPDIRRSPREECLELATEAVTKDRNTSYGDPEDNFLVIRDLWVAYLKGKGIDVSSLSSADVAALMVLMKVSRLITSPSKLDHWVDIAGYGACGADAAKAK